MKPSRPTFPRVILDVVRGHKIVSGTLLSLLLFYLLCVHYIEPHQVAITWDRFSGKLGVDQRAGFHLTAPWVQVVRIDKRPLRVCLTSTGRTFNCKLVQFVPSAYREFVALQGFHYYWLSNRLSFNVGYDEEYRGVADLLRGYTYGTQRQPFVRVLEEYPDQQ